MKPISKQEGIYQSDLIWAKKWHCQHSTINVKRFTKKAMSKARKRKEEEMIEEYNFRE